MIYPYKCQEHEWEVIKSVAHIDDPEHCPTCGALGERFISPKIQLHGTKVDEYEYSPAFGQWTRGRKHRDELAKRYGMIEVGNENPDKMHDNFAKERERTAAQRYNEI